MVHRKYMLVMKHTDYKIIAWETFFSKVAFPIKVSHFGFKRKFNSYVTL